MTVLQSGNVGIGTTTPATRLEVTDEIFSSGSVAGYKFSDRVLGPTKAWSWFASNGSASLWEQSSNQNKLTIFANGNATLAGTLTQNSDERLKQNIQHLNNPLEKLTALSGYTYRWKDAGRGSEEQIGLLAQEVEKQFPQLVRTDENGTKSVAYQNLVPVLIEAIKQQQQTILAQQKAIEKLQALVTGH
jgi:hypothetical protein